jgi:signal transduction histidine kinase
VSADTQLVPANAQSGPADDLVRVGLMAWCIAHDVNNHLTAAYGQLELARIRSSEESPGSPHIWYARSEIENCCDLLHHLVPGGMPESGGERAHADPHEVLQGVLERFAPTLEAKGISLALSLEPDPPTVQAPPWALKHVFSNLVGNACEAMQDGGELRVCSRRRNGHLRMRFSDTGGGIPEDRVTRVFEPFFTTKEPSAGHGLGLAICRAVLEHFGGSIAAESKDEEGTEFTVDFDAGQPE